jgi:agmatine deiminase
MPAEWEPQDAIWFSWPRADHLWPGRMLHVQRELLKAISILVRSHKVGLNGIHPGDKFFASLLMEYPQLDRERLLLSGVSNNDAWCRDHGPTFVEDRQTGRLAGIDWNFNAWGEKYQPWDKDNRVARQMLEQLEIPRIECPFVGEGGGIEVDGKGTVMLTESVWLNSNRNPNVKRTELEKWLLEHLGCSRAHWFTDGLAADDTDGHVDMFARFASDSAIVVCVEKNGSHPQYRALQKIRDQLSGFLTLTRGHYDIVELPMPEPVFTDTGDICPASYGNFLIFNQFVLVPQYRQPRSDAQALGILGECFPAREIVGVDCFDFITEGGAIHCLSQQQPSFSKTGQIDP